MAIVAAAMRAVVLGIVGAAVLGGGAAWGAACDARPEIRDQGLKLVRPSNINQVSAIELVLNDLALTKEAKCEANAKWVRFRATLSARLLNNSAANHVYSWLDGTTELSAFNLSLKAKPFETYVYVAISIDDTEKDAKIAFKSRTRDLPTGPLPLSKDRFDVSGDRTNARQVSPRLVEQDGAYRLVFAVCIQECDNGKLAEVAELEKYEMLQHAAVARQDAKAGASGIPPPPAPPIPPDRAAGGAVGGAVPLQPVGTATPGLPPTQEPPQPPANPTKTGQKNTPPAGTNRAGGAPAATVSAVLGASQLRSAPYVPPQPSGYFKLNFYESVSGADFQVSGKALAVWGDCSTRDDYGSLGDISAVPVYGTRQPNQTLCIVLQQPGDAEPGFCLRIVQRAVNPSPNRAAVPDFFYGAYNKELPVCSTNLKPWNVAFTLANGQPLDLASAEALIDGGQAQLAGIPVSGEKGIYTASLRRETLDILRTPDKALDAVDLKPEVFKRLGVDVNPLSRTITVRVEPQVVNLAGMSFEFWTAESNRKIGSTECNLELDVPDGRNDTDNVQRGGAWASLAGQKLQLTHAGEQRYRLRAGSATGDEMLRKLFVAASNGDFQKRAIKFRHQTRESERDCYLVDTTIKDTELLGSGGGGSRVIVRDVGQPTSGLIILATTDSRINQDPSLKEADYQFAVEQALVHLGAVPKYIMSATNKPFAFSKVMIGNVGTPPIDLGAQSGDPFSARGLDTITRLVNDGVLNRRPALQVNDARRTVEDVFKARGVAAGGRALPAAIIHVGDIVQKPGGENFCNSSTPNTLATSDWLPAERQFLKISFGSPETIAALVKANTLRELERAQRLSTYSCAYNVPGRVAEFVIAIPVGQTAAGSSEVRSLLLAEVQKLFSIKSQ